MSAQLHNQIEQAYADLAHQRAELAAISIEDAGTTTTVMARNRAVEVIVDGRAAVTDIRFPTGAYRSMAGPELGALIVDTIADARKAAAEAVAQRYRSVLPDGLLDHGLLDGGLDVDALLARAARTLNDPRLDSALRGDEAP